MKPRSEWPDIMTAKDIKQCLGWGHVRTYDIMKRPDFPLVDKKAKRCKQITAEALWAYINREVPNGKD